MNQISKTLILGPIMAHLAPNLAPSFFFFFSPAIIQYNIKKT